jgi:hypothetical protein
MQSLNDCFLRGANALTVVAEAESHGEGEQPVVARA